MGSCHSTESWRKKMKLKKPKDSAAGAHRSSGTGAEEKSQRFGERMVCNGGSETVCLHTQQGRKGTNQDAMIVLENFTSRNDTIFCGVFDGHGPFGHVVAKKVRDLLPVKLSTEWGTNLSGHENPSRSGSMSGSMDSEEMASFRVDDDLLDSAEADAKERVPEMLLPLRLSFLKAFKSMDKELKFHPIVDCFCSGSTAVTLVKQGQDLVIGNLGDSRAIMATRDKDNNLVAEQLTVDLKPNLPREAARIQQCKGRVFALQDEPEVARVWLPNNDSPGLAMARAFGDFCLKDYGLISVPDITYRQLSEKDEFIVLASDGVWDVLSNKEVVDIVVSAPTRRTAARAVVDCAVRAWRIKFPTSKSDDCAVVCLFLESLSPVSSQKADSAAALQPAEPAVAFAQKKDLDIDGSITSGAHPIVPTTRDADEIVQLSEDTKAKRIPEKSQSTRSLAECITTREEDEWSALEGVTRVNSLVNLPRLLSGNKRSYSWRKWL